MTTITNVTESKTFEVFNRLLAAGFDATIVRMFDYGYDKKNFYLAVYVKDAFDRTIELWDLRGDMKAILAKSAHEEKPFFQLRFDHDYAEFISEEDWEQYRNSIK